MRAPYSLRDHNQHSNSYQPRKNILQSEIKSPSGSPASCLGSGSHSQAGYSALFLTPRDLLGLRGLQAAKAHILTGTFGDIPAELSLPRSP